MSNDQPENQLYLIRDDFQKCHDIAQKLDMGNPDLPGAFTGSVSERIHRQLVARGLPFFTME